MNSYTSFKIDKQDLQWIIRIFLFSLIIKFAYFWQFVVTSGYPFVNYSDSQAYFYWARDICTGDFGSQAFMKWPLYAYFLAGILKISGNSLLPVFLLQLFLGALNCACTYLVARHFIDKHWPAALAAFACAMYGLFTFYDTLLVYTTLSLFLNFIFILYILAIENNISVTRFLIAGILLGIAAITQANIVPCGILLGSWLLFRGKVNLKGSVKMSVSFLAGIFLIVGIVTLRNYTVEKDFVPIAGHIGLNFYAGNSQKATGTFFFPPEITLNQEDMFRDSKIIARIQLGRDLKTSEVSDFWLQKGLRFIRDNPVHAAKLILKKLMFVFSPREYVHDVEYYFREDKIAVSGLLLKDLRFIMPFTMLGMLLGLKRLRSMSMLYIIVFSSAFSIALFYVTARYRLVLVPFFMIFAAYAAANIWGAIREKQLFRFWVVFSVLVLLAIACNRIYSFRDNPTPAGVKEALIEQHMLQALGFENTGEYSNALKELDQANAISSGANRRVLFRQGVILFQLGDLVSAEKKFKEVIAISPLSVDAYYNLGFIYNQQMQFAKAKSPLEYAVMLDPDNPKAHFELATAYKETGDYKHAKEHLLITLKKLRRWQLSDKDVVVKELESLKQ